MKKYEKSFALVSQMVVLLVAASIYSWMVPMGNQMPLA